MCFISLNFHIIKNNSLYILLKYKYNKIISYNYLLLYDIILIQQIKFFTDIHILFKQVKYLISLQL